MLAMKQKYHFIPADGSIRKLWNLRNRKSSKRKPCCSMYGSASIGKKIWIFQAHLSLYKEKEAGNY